MLVVGAGPTGLTLAAQLQAFGTRFRLIDRQLDRVHEPRAHAVQPRTREVLCGLGIADTMVERRNMHRLVRYPSCDALHDVSGKAHERLGPTEPEATAHHLVRPDGHIGYRAAGTDLDGVTKYLSRWVSRPSGADLEDARLPGAKRLRSQPSRGEPGRALGSGCALRACPGPREGLSPPH